MAHSLISIITEKVAKSEYLANFFRSVVSSYRDYHVWMDIVFQMSFCRDFSDFGKFCRYS